MTGIDGALGEQNRLVAESGGVATSRSGADLMRDVALTKGGYALTSSKDAALLQQEINAAEVSQALTITDIDPASDVEAGGATITITGTGFVDVLAVLFDGISGTSLTVNSATEIEVDAPAHAAAVVDVAVVTEHGSVVEVDGFEYTA